MTKPQNIKPPSWWRSRFLVLDDLLGELNQEIKQAEAKDDKPLLRKLSIEIATHRQGRIPDRMRNGKNIEGLIDEKFQSRYPDVHGQVEARKADIVDVPLSFSEITKYNTWFEMNPDRVAGTEVITTSRNFPIQIKTKRSDIDRVLKVILNLKEDTINLLLLKSKSLKLKLSLAQLEI